MFDEDGFTSEYKIRYKMSIDLDNDEINYIKYDDSDDWSWEAQNLETVLDKLKNLIKGV
jgi:hypothetical protein